MSARFLDATLTSIVRGNPQTFSLFCIGHGADEAAMVSGYETHLTEHYKDSESPTTVDDIVAIPVFDQWVTETGMCPLDFAQVASLYNEALSYEDAGLWENCQEIAPVNLEWADIEALRQSFPPDAASALNWDPAKQLLFLVRAYGEAEDGSEDLVIIVQARNAPAAAWSWRFHAKSLDPVRRPIRVEGMCPIIAAAPKESSDS